MALVLLDRAQQQGTANTTVSFTLNGFIPSFKTFAGVGNGNTTYYAAADAFGNSESGLGTYSAANTTLARTEIFESSNANAAVTFTGTVNVFITYPSKKAVYLDAAGKLSAAASLMVNVPAGDIVATNVQEAINEVGGNFSLYIINAATRLIQTQRITAQLALGTS